MPVNEGFLSQKYHLVKLSVINSTPISKRTTAIIAELGDTSAEGRTPEGKVVIISLTAKSRVANKLISIVEIAKRELADHGITCFQYNALTSEMIEIKCKPHQASNVDGTGNDDENDGGSEDAFETMTAQSEVGTKKRTVPVMTTYLSTSSVKELKIALGEQR